LERFPSGGIYLAGDRRVAWLQSLIPGSAVRAIEGEGGAHVRHTRRTRRGREWVICSNARKRK
jgi:hypothetical protein